MEILIKGGNNPSILRRTQSRQQNSQPREAEAVSRPTQHCQICNGSYHITSKCWHRCKKEVCAKSAWHNKLKCPHKNEKGQASEQSDKKGSASRGRSKERRRGNSNKARRVTNDPEDRDFDAPTSGEENDDNRTYDEEQIRKVLSELAREGKKKAKRVKLTLNKDQLRNVVLNLTKKKNLSDTPPMYLRFSTKPSYNLLVNCAKFVLTQVQQLQ